MPQGKLSEIEEEKKADHSVHIKVDWWRKREKGAWLKKEYLNHISSETASTKKLWQYQNAENKNINTDNELQIKNFFCLSWKF